MSPLMEAAMLKISFYFQLTITNEGDAEAVGLAVVNTIIGGCGGGITALFLYWRKGRKWSYLNTLNGTLTGT